MQIKVDIVSPQNPLIKRIHSLGLRKNRYREGCFWAEGIRVVLGVLESYWEVEALMWAPSLLRSERALQAVAKASIKKFSVSNQAFRRMSVREDPQGLGALVRIPERRLEDLDVGPQSLFVVLEAPKDPGNIGTVVRTVDCVGGRGIILLGNGADPYDSKSVRASMGSLFGLPVVSGVEVSKFSAWAKEVNMNLIGTSAKADLCYQEVSYNRPISFLFGSEKTGMSKDLREVSHKIVQIPIFGTATSLNLASAVAVMVYGTGFI